MKKLYLISLVVIVLGTVAYFVVPDKNMSPVKGQYAYTAQEAKQKEIQKKLERRKHGYAKPDKPDEYLNYLYFLKTGNDPSKEYPHNHQLHELKSAKYRRAQLKATTADLDWVERGPGNVGGRTRGFIIDPTDNSGNTWFAGSVGGGIWKTTDAGQNWVPVSDNWPNMAVSSLAMAPSNSDVIYAGTGEGFWNLDAIMGNGIFKSVDHGVTWNLLGSTESNGAFRYVNRIAVDKNNADVVFAATNWGIYKSTDGGASWTNVFMELYSNNTRARRVQDLRMSPDNSNVLIAGVNDYGVIQSFDGGENWKLVYAKSEGRIEVCISDFDTNVMYALTSESNLSVSTDGGDNWVDVTFAGSKKEYLSGQGWYNNTMVAHPSSNNNLYIGGVDLYSVTTTAGAENGTVAFDVVDNTASYFFYGNVEGQYLGGGVKITYANATDISDVEIRFGGANQQKAHRFTASSVVASDANFVYENYVDVPFTVWNGDKQLMVSFLDDDKDGAFNLTESSKEQIIIHSGDYNADNPSVSIGVEGGAAVEQVAKLHPKMQPNVVWNPAGFVDVKLVLNKLTLKAQSMSYQQLSKWNADIAASDYVHADHHNLIVDAAQGSPFRLISCNDGGVAFSDNGGIEWTSPNNGYNTSQFYGVARHPELNRYAGGLQDNGTWMSDENPEKLTAWSEVAGGDGFSTVWNQKDPNKIVGCYYNNTLFGTYNGGQTWVDLTGVHGYYDKEISPFITRITNSKSNPDLLLVGNKNGISTSEDFGLTWKLVNVPSAAWSSGDYNPQTAISPANSRNIWAGTTVSESQPLALSTDGGNVYSLVNSPISGYAANISRIIAHPTDENSAFVLFSLFGKPKIFKTTDLGETWTELSGFGANDTSDNGFPNVAVFTLVVMPHNTDILWAGTEIGLFESTDGGVSWTYADNGLPAVSIWDMKIVGQQVVVGTHGRGVWTVDIPEIPAELVQPVISGGKSPDGKLNVTITLERDYDNVELFIDDELFKSFENTTIGTIKEEIEITSTKSRIGIQAKGTVGNSTIASNYLSVENYKIKETVQKYMNPFTTNRYDFTGSGFSVSKELFDNWAIHCDRSANDDGDDVYEENTNHTYVLSYPIEVLADESKAFITYRDIALVEAGETGNNFGDEKFWDYVVVEGTKDGVNWLPLADGYDVNYSSKWKSFADAENKYANINKAPNSADLFEEHTINLHNTFEAGDIILVRFRLYSDANTTGWGWIIDDLIIQETGTSLDLDKNSDAVFKVGPNPATDYIELSLNSAERGQLSLVMYDMAGRAVVIKDYQKTNENWSETIELNQMAKGTKIVTISINGKVYKTKIVVSN